MTQQPISIDSLTLLDLVCHHPGITDACVIFEGGKHRSEVNYCENTNPVVWRLECSSCYTVLKLFPSYDEAILAGKQHAVDPKLYYPPWHGEDYDEES